MIYVYSLISVSVSLTVLVSRFLGYATHMAVENFLGSSDWTAFRLCGSFALESWHALVEEFDIRDAKCLKRCSFRGS